ncbi:MAG TPA: hypothetical protein VL346_04815 [Acidobacteriaceae bacterium]|nr:hypothetical protein [Acidobacteriaceae bacterium]
MRRRLMWVAGVMAAALPVCQPVFGQYVTKPNTTDFAVVTTIRNSPDAPAAAVDRQKQAVDPTKIAGCPVAMRARRMWGGAAMRAGDKAAPAAGQQIHLEIDRGRYAAVEAKVTVHGTRSKAGMVLTLSSSEANNGASAARSFTLKQGKNAGSGGSAAMMASDLKLDGFTSVTSITLNSVTYADGTGWNAAAGRSCVVEPDPLMLVK